LGSLEAEGLYFDAAWVLGMTDGFLPAMLNVPRFIPHDIAITHQIPITMHRVFVVFLLPVLWLFQAVFLSAVCC
jgi:hypothetical protein